MVWTISQVEPVEHLRLLLFYLLLLQAVYALEIVMVIMLLTYTADGILKELDGNINRLPEIELDLIRTV